MSDSPCCCAVDARALLTLTHTPMCCCRRTTNDFKAHNDLPKARIKRIMQVMMQADEQCASVRMIRAEAPILFAKACEMFILELSLRAYGYSVIRQRKNLNKQDVRNAVNDTINLDFLSHILKENDAPSGADAADNSGVNQVRAGLIVWHSPRVII